MDELSPTQLAELTADLALLIGEIEHTLAASKAASIPAQVDQGQVGRLTRMDAIQQQQMVQANRTRLEARLRLAMAARNTLAAEDYGLCRRCDDPIGYRRLKARPETPLCLECKSETEQR